MANLIFRHNLLTVWLLVLLNASLAKYLSPNLYHSSLEHEGPTSLSKDGSTIRTFASQLDTSDSTNSALNAGDSGSGEEEPLIDTNGETDIPVSGVESSMLGAGLEGFAYSGHDTQAAGYDVNTQDTEDYEDVTEFLVQDIPSSDAVNMGADKNGGKSPPNAKAAYETNVNTEVHEPREYTKKVIFISVDKGVYIAGGTQLFGLYKTVKLCMKACSVIPTCFSGDYNPKLHKCYIHTNLTACNQPLAHPQFVHFNKVPCSIPDAPTGIISLGVSMSFGIEQAGIESLPQCIKKCVSAGGGVPASIAAGNFAAAARQACFAIDYDFATHKCFFFGYNILSFDGSGHGFFAHCLLQSAATTSDPCSLGCMANPTVIHITFCPQVV